MTLPSRALRLPALAALALLTLAAPLRTAQAQMGADNVRIEVKVESENEKTKPAAGAKGKPDPTTHQDRTLTIMLSGKPRSPETRTGKWTVYSKDAKDKDIASADSAEFKLDLPASGQQKVESKKVSLTFTPAHIEGGGGKAVGKKVEATGNKYYGYSIIIKDGEKVVGESYDPPGLKQELTKK
jgi:hypothetical protein